MDLHQFDESFWRTLQQVLSTHNVVIDRPRGTAHPRYPELIYPLDYGYVEGIKAVDGNELDVWKGSKSEERVSGILCTVDTLKGDTEMKILLCCTQEEMQTVYQFQNSRIMHALLIQRESSAFDLSNDRQLA